MIWALYHHGISHKSALRRGRWVARVRYYAWRTVVPRLAWTNGTMAVPRRGVSRALWYRPRVRARGRQPLTLRLRSCGSVGPCAATQSVKRESTASSGGASPGSGSDGSSAPPRSPSPVKFPGRDELSRLLRCWSKGHENRDELIC